MKTTIETLLEKITPLLPLFACDNATEGTPHRYSILTAEAKGFADVTAVAWKHGKQKKREQPTSSTPQNSFPKLLEALELTHNFHNRYFTTQSLTEFQAVGYTGTEDGEEMKK